MKKLLAIISASLLAVNLMFTSVSATNIDIDSLFDDTATSTGADSSKGNRTFTATVTSVSDKLLLVKPDKNTTEATIASYVVEKGNNSDSFSIGDKVNITYDGTSTSEGATSARIVAINITKGDIDSDVEDETTYKVSEEPKPKVTEPITTEATTPTVMSTTGTTPATGNSGVAVCIGALLGITALIGLKTKTR